MKGINGRNGEALISNYEVFMQGIILPTMRKKNQILRTIAAEQRLREMLIIQ
jgi:hypothetical protein